MLEADPQFRRLRSGEAERLVAAALTDGRRLAEEMESRDPRALAAAREVVIDIAEADDFGTTTIVADRRGNRVTLYRRPLARLSALAGFDVSPIYIAHELYHCLDEARPVPLVRRHRITILGLWTNGFSSLPEIAAGAFAQNLLGLPWHPKWLELQLAVSEGRPAYGSGKACRRGVPLSIDATAH